MRVMWASAGEVIEAVDTATTNATSNRRLTESSRRTGSDANVVLV